MKSVKFFFLLVLSMVVISGNAEKISFCNALLKIIESSDMQFSDIKLSEIKGETFGSRYNTSVEITEATSCYIEKVVSDLTYTAEFGTFTTEDDAKTKLNELTKLLSDCFKTISFVNYRDGLFKTYQTVFLNNGENGFRFYDAGFKINKYGSSYELVFEYDEAKTSGFSANQNSEPVYTDYYLIENQQDYSQFSLDIRKLLSEAKTAFSIFKGEEIPADFSLFTNYKSKYNPAGFTNCFIEDRGMKIINFVIPVASGLTADQTKPLHEEYITKLKAAFGSNYALSFKENGMVVTFVNKNQPQKKIADLLIQYESSNYKMEIYIAADK